MLFWIGSSRKEIFDMGDTRGFIRGYRAGYSEGFDERARRKTKLPQFNEVVLPEIKSFFDGKISAREVNAAMCCYRVIERQLRADD